MWKEGENMKSKRCGERAGTEKEEEKEEEEGEEKKKRKTTTTDNRNTKVTKDRLSQSTVWIIFTSLSSSSTPSSDFFPFFTGLFFRDQSRFCTPLDTEHVSSATQSFSTS